MAQLAFLPFLRRGLSSLIAAPSSARAAVDVAVQVSGAAAGATLTLRGPGDVAGFDASAIARAWPADGADGIEPNYFPLLELVDADLPWRFTPAAPDASERLSPWLCLLALRDDERGPLLPANGTKPLPSIVVPASAPLPLLSQSWAWAHVQAPAGADAAALAAASSSQLFARLLCPRRLDASAAYGVFLVPAFAAGVAAGLGKSAAGELLAPEWPDGARTADLELPIYFQWRFRTGPGGDFLSLATAIAPRRAGPEVGVRALDVSRATAGMTGPALPTASASGTLPLEGALISPAAKDARDASDWPANDAAAPAFTAALSAIARGAQDPPVLGPPIYGRRQAAPSSPPWLDQLNRDPRSRVAASLGGLVVEGEAQALVAAAFAQVESVRPVNERLHRTQASRELASRLHARHLASAGPDGAVRATAPLHGKLAPRGSALTFAQLIGAGPLASGVLTPHFARLARPSGPAGLAAGSQRALPPLQKLNATALQATRSPAQFIAPALVPALPDGALTPETTTSLDSIVRDGLVANLLARLQPTGDKDYGELLLAPAVAPSPQALAFARLRNGEPDTDEPRVRVPPHPKVPAGANAFFAALGRLVTDLAAPLAPVAAPPPAPLDALQEVTAAADPLSTVPAQLSLAQSGVQQVSADPLAAVRAAPEFAQPMSAPLFALSRDWLLPNLAALPPESAAVLLENRRFIEAYLAGLSDAFARKLLWSGFPGQLSATFFRQFWDVSSYAPSAADPAALAESFRDAAPIAEWRGALGDNGARRSFAGQDADGHLVLLFRSRLFARYPSASVFAVKANADGLWHADAEVRAPVFSALCAPDLALFGFELTRAQALGSAQDAGWLFVAQEHAHEARFGLHATATRGSAQPQSWDLLAWTDFAGAYVDLAAAAPDTSAIQSPSRWHASEGSRASHLARITFRRPARAVFRAADLMGKDR